MTPTMPSTAGQPAVDLTTRLQTEALLEQVYRTLRANLPTAPHLTSAVPAAITAVHLYEARQLPACLAQINSVMADLAQAQATPSATR
jgi:hypothetical protein